MSSGVTWKAADSMRARVRGKDAGKIIVSVKGQGVCGMRFGGVNVDPLVTR